MEFEKKYMGLNSSHYCYLLISETKKKASYIGYSVNPCRRLRQHNGEIKNGAKKTKLGTPWEIGICVGGFPDRISALRFEWAWQHPNICRATREYMNSWKIVKKKKSEEKNNVKTVLKKRQWSIQQRIWILVCIVTLTPWKDMNLDVFVLNNNIENIIKEYIKKLGKLQNNYKITDVTIDSLLMFIYNGTDCNFENGTKFLRCDYNAFKDIQNSNVNSIENEIVSHIQDNSMCFSLDYECKIETICTICQQKIENNRKYILFPCCDGMNIHVSCIQPWGESYKLNNENSLFDISAPLIPEQISCPCCFQIYNWSEVKLRHIKKFEFKNGNEVENKVNNNSITNNSLEINKSIHEKAIDSETLKKKDIDMGFDIETNRENSLLNYISFSSYNNIDAGNDNNKSYKYKDETSPNCDNVFLSSEDDNDIKEVSQRCEFIDLTIDSE
ncbi:hypothetical protein RS030_111974 [Cryptosporidium xiaoi]|uniref:Structure-specific endonuclease subunit SLX1 homolog n=1 Tax=Cryptosporidium xiaoi TaxID=659607 RepID=A0AAV9Y3E7_9CRYT